MIYYQYRSSRARRAVRGIDEQIRKAEDILAGRITPKRNRFLQVKEATTSI
ncbi:IS1634 family transposase, partial [Arachnia propionica]